MATSSEFSTVNQLSLRLQIAEAEQRSFGKRLAGYLEELGLSQVQVGKAVDVSAATISNWIADARAPGRKQLIKTALFLSEQLALRNENERGALLGHDLGTILSDLLQAAGHSFSPTPENRVWDRLHSEAVPTLRAGFLPVAGLTGPNDDGQLCLDIARVVVSLIGARLELGSAAKSWKELTEQLTAGDIDIIVPVIAASPHRLGSIIFSHSIGLMMRHVCVVPKDTITGVFSRESDIEKVSTAESKPNRLHRISSEDFANLCMVRTGDGVSEIFAKMGDRSRPASIQVNNLVEAKDVLLASRAATDPIPCMIAAQGTANEMCSDGQLGWLRLPEVYDVSLMLAFALLRNEPRLLEAINVAVQAMRDSGMLADYYKLRKKTIRHEGLVLEPIFKSKNRRGLQAERQHS